MKKECLLCKLNEAESAKLWHFFYQTPEALQELDVSQKDINNHFATHRVQQPQVDSLTKSESLRIAEKLPQRLQNILLLLQKNPGLSLDQIAALFYLKDNPASALRSASRDLKRLMILNFIHRVFLENVPGEGPRPRHEVPPLFFLGNNARSYIQKKTGNNPVKREEWLNHVSDLSSWNRYYHLWLSRDIVKQIAATLDLNKDRRSREITDWKISFNPLDWISPINFSLDDPLGTFKRINADGVFALSFQKEERSALLPIFYYLDRGSKSIEQIKQTLLAHSALARSRALPKQLQFFSYKTIAPVLCVSETPERRDLLLKASKGTSALETTIIVTDKSSLGQGLEEDFWQNLLDGQRVSLLKSALLVAGSSPAGAEKSLKKISVK